MSEKKLAEEPSQEEKEHAGQKEIFNVSDATAPRQAAGINIVENPLMVRPPSSTIIPHIPGIITS